MVGIPKIQIRTWEVDIKVQNLYMDMNQKKREAHLRMADRITHLQHGVQCTYMILIMSILHQKETRQPTLLILRC